MTTLPALVVLTDAALAAERGRNVRDVLTAAVDAGLRGVLVRERHLRPGERQALVEWVDGLLAGVGGLVIVADPQLHPGQNVHLRTAAPRPAQRPAVMGRSCHDAAELARADREGCDYATLSPIFPTPSKPGYGPAVGIGALHGAPLPVYALGGITAVNAADCVAAGAHGVAVMGGVMAAADPAAAVSRLLASLDATGGR